MTEKDLKNFYQVYGAEIQHHGQQERWFFAAYSGGRLVEKIEGEHSDALRKLAKDVVFRSWQPRGGSSIGTSYDLPDPGNGHRDGITPFALAPEEQKLFSYAIRTEYEAWNKGRGINKNTVQEPEISGEQRL